MSLVISEISYTNILPLFYYLNREQLKQYGCEFVTQIPSQLNHAMAAGQVDVGGISSFAYAENFDKYHIFPHLSVSSKSSVGSIFLFSKQPIEELKEYKIALTSTSATSVHLVKIILEHFLGAHNDYTVMAPKFQEMISTHDACLLIGDEAIMTSWIEGERYYRYDLGELWYNYTGYSMTYAVLAIRNEVLHKQSDLQYLYEQFLFSKKKSIENGFYPMIHEIRRTFGGKESFWNDYFQGLCYDLGEKELIGLRYYYDLAFKLGYLKDRVESISVWGALDHCHSM